MALTAGQQDKLSTEALVALDMLGALRNGRTMNEFAERLTAVVHAVIDMAEVDEKGKVRGPKGRVTLVFEVEPNQTNPEGFVTIRESIAEKRPEDRSHVMYVGRGGTLHATDPRNGLFAVRDRPDGGKEFTVTIPNDDDPEPDEDGAAREPYKD